MVVRNKVTVAKDGFDSHRGLLRTEVIFHRKGAKYAPRTENAEDRKKDYFNRLKTKDKKIIGRGFTQIIERYKSKKQETKSAEKRQKIEARNKKDD